MRFPGHGPWNLPIVGFEVLNVTFGFMIDITACGDAGATSSLRLEGPFELTDPDRGTVRLDASGDAWEDLAAVLALRHERIAAATAISTDASTLRVQFSSGCVLSAGPHPQYENWEIHGPGFMLVCTPGGGIAAWDMDKPTEINSGKGARREPSRPTG